MAMRGRGAGRGIPSRPPRMVINRVYEEFKTMSEWRQEDDHDILLVYLPGFQKEYIKVTTEDVNIVRVRGERLVSENKWSRFQEDYRVPENCDMRGIRAKFEGGKLTITMPRKITSKPPPPPPPPTTTTTSRVAPETEEQPFRRTMQEETLRKIEETLRKPEERRQTGRWRQTPTTTTRVPPETEEQPFRRTKQEETLRKIEETLRKPKERPQTGRWRWPPTPTTTTRVAPETEEQPFRRTKQEETLRKPEEPKEKQPDKPQTGRLEDNTLSAPPKPTSSSAPTTKQPPSKPAPQAKEAMELTNGTLLRGGFEHDAVEKPGVGKKTDLDKGKGKEATLEEETKKGLEGKPSSSGVSGGFRAGLEKVVAGRGLMNEDRKLLVNVGVGVGVLIIAALAVQVSYTIGLIGKGK